MKKPIPIIREREGNEKKTFPKFGNGKGMKKSIPIIRERESGAFILGNGWEREFPLTPDSSLLNRLYFARGRRLSRAQKGEIGLGWCQGEASIRDDPQWQRMTRKDHNAAPLWDLGPDVWDGWD